MSLLKNLYGKTFRRLLSTNCEMAFQSLIFQIGNQFQSQRDFQPSNIRNQTANNQFTDKFSMRLDTNRLILFWRRINFSICTGKCLNKNGRIPFHFVTISRRIKFKNQIAYMSSWIKSLATSLLQEYGWKRTILKRIEAADPGWKQMILGSKQAIFWAKADDLRVKADDPERKQTIPSEILMCKSRRS